ncbi:MAG TPA: ATP-binding protein [Longimicrobiales bacterium]|nr:ATP-binding protein [Longimicrobiales bacterium]
MRTRVALTPMMRRLFAAVFGLVVLLLMATLASEVSPPVVSPALASGVIIAVSVALLVNLALSRQALLEEEARVRRELERSEARYRALVEATSAAVWCATPDGSWAESSPSWERLTGVSTPETRGSGWLRSVHPEDVEPTRRTWEEALRAESFFQVVHRVRVAGGEYRTFAARAAPVLNPDGSVREWVGVHNDITERVAIQEAQRFLAAASKVLAGSLDADTLMESLARLATETLADFAVSYLVAEDGALHRTAVAHADAGKEALVRELAGRSSHSGAALGVSRVVGTGEPLFLPELGAEHLAMALPDPAHQAVARALDPQSAIVVPLRAGNRTVGALAVCTSRGGRRPLDAADLELIQDLGGRAALAVENARLFRDVTIARGVAEQASHAKSQFLAVMSHELRTPLTAVVGFSDLLLAEVSGPLNAAQKEQVGRVKAGARHLVSIIDEILTFSRVEAGRETVRLERVDVAALAREAALLIEPQTLTKGLRLDVEVPDEPVWLETDPGKLRQILLNLLGNAAKFTDEGVVALELERDGGAHVLLRVRDTGPGIEEADHGRIFEPFTQIDQSTTRTRGGTGLGLPVSKRLARLLGGDVVVESRPGAGSTFTLCLRQRAAG